MHLFKKNYEAFSVSACIDLKAMWAAGANKSLLTEYLPSLSDAVQNFVLDLLCCHDHRLTKWVNAVNVRSQVHTDNATFNILRNKHGISKPSTSICLHYALGYIVLYERALLQRMKWLFDVCVRLFDSRPAVVLQCLHCRKCDYTLCCEFISCVSKPTAAPACLFLSKQEVLKQCAWWTVCVRTLCYYSCWACVLLMWI